MRTLNGSESALVCNLGVYGCWILKHGKRLSKKSAVARAYARYLSRGNSAALKLFRVIDWCVVTQQLPPVIRDYETALKDLLGTDTLYKASH